MSSDYWGDEDPEYIELLKNIILPGEEPAPGITTEISSSKGENIRQAVQTSRKRPRSPHSDDGETPTQHQVMSMVDQNKSTSNYMQSKTYGASSFGGFGEYMHRKRAKLQIQNAEMDTEGSTSVSRHRIFSGLQIYVRGILAVSATSIHRLVDQRLDRTFCPGPQAVNHPTRWYISCIFR
jgi:DNA repair protein REV1